MNENEVPFKVKQYRSEERSFGLNGVIDGTKKFEIKS